MGVGVFFAEKRGWVDRENAFFICFGMSGHHLPHPRRSLYAPQVETTAPSAPGRTAQHRQQRRPYQIQGRPHTAGRAPAHTPGRWTRCTGLHSIPDRPRRCNRDGGGAKLSAQCVRNCADLDTLKHERFSTQECVQNH